VISPKILKELQNLPYVAWKCKEFEADDIKDAQLIFAATNIKLVNEFVCQSAHEFQWVKRHKCKQKLQFHDTGNY
jgi:precorrin-2 dehydrogenase / sirohydrochlorin ferrochelatase